MDGQVLMLVARGEPLDEGTLWFSSDDWDYYDFLEVDPSPLDENGCPVRASLAEYRDAQDEHYFNLTRPIRHTYSPTELQRWARAVKTRDGNECQNCGVGADLHAHHKKKKADHPWIALDLDNGITLCSSCHKDAHPHGFRYS